MSTPIRLRVRSTVDLLAIVPYLLGFHPTDSLVVVAMRAGQLVFAARGDLPGPASGTGPATAAEQAAAFTGQLSAVVSRQGAEAVSVVGYGPAGLVDDAVPRVCEALAGCGLRIFDALRVTDGRYWSYLSCDDPRCCPPGGTAFDLTTSSVTAEAVFAGQTVLPDRAAVARQVAPADGPVRAAMRRATEDAADRLAALGAAGPHAAAPGAVLRAGKAAVREALARCEAGGRLADEEVAWLTVLLAHEPVRDFAWERTTPDEWQIAMWTDVLCRAQPELVPAPACLLAFAAWRFGHGALASLALERALDADPAYAVALVLDDVLRRGISPSALDHLAGQRSPR